MMKTNFWRGFPSDTITGLMFSGLPSKILGCSRCLQRMWTKCIIIRKTPRYMNLGTSFMFRRVVTRAIITIPWIPTPHGVRSPQVILLFVRRMRRPPNCV